VPQRLRSTFVLALVTMLVSVAGASAQGAPGASAPGAKQKAASHHGLDVTVSSTEGYDTDPNPEARAALGVGGQDGAGYSTSLGTTAEYSFRGRRVQIHANESSSIRYFQPLNSVLPAYFGNVSHGVAGGLTAGSRRTTFNINQTAMYTSSPLYNIFPLLDAAVVTAAPDYTYAVSDVRAYAYASGATLARQVTSRMSLSGGGDWQRSQIRFAGGGRLGQDVDMYRVRGQLSERIGRNTTAVAGYYYRVGRLDYGVTSVALGENGVETGLDHTKPLSGTRRLTFGGRVGVSTIQLPALVADPSTKDHRYNAMLARMSIGYEFARRWVAQGTYLKALDYVAGLGEPISSRSATVGLNGGLTRRLDLVTSASYANGRSALNSVSSEFDTYTGDVRLRYALGQALVVYVEELYYFYDFGKSRTILPGIPSSLQRQGVRVGFSLRVPAL
jgi:hypothetical protein